MIPKKRKLIILISMKSFSTNNENLAQVFATRFVEGLNEEEQEFVLGLLTKKEREYVKTGTGYPEEVK